MKLAHVTAQMPVTTLKKIVKVIDINLILPAVGKPKG